MMSLATAPRPPTPSEMTNHCLKIRRWHEVEGALCWLLSSDSPDSPDFLVYVGTTTGDLDPTGDLGRLQGPTAVRSPRTSPSIRQCPRPLRFCQPKSQRAAFSGRVVVSLFEQSGVGVVRASAEEARGEGTTGRGLQDPKVVQVPMYSSNKFNIVVVYWNPLGISKFQPSSAGCWRGM